MAYVVLIPNSVHDKILSWNYTPGLIVRFLTQLEGELSQDVISWLHESDESTYTVAVPNPDTGTHYTFIVDIVTDVQDRIVVDCWCLV